MKQKSPDKVVPAGTYDFMISLVDDDPIDPKTANYSLKLTVTESEPVLKPLCCRHDFALPRIKSISTFGELIVVWDKPMQVQRNATIFNEKLKKIYLIEDEKA